MTQTSEPQPEAAALRESVSRLSAALTRRCACRTSGTTSAHSGWHRAWSPAGRAHRRRYVDVFGNREEHFRALANFARSVSVTRVTRPAAGASLDDLIERHQRDLASEPRIGSEGSQRPRR